MPMPSSPDMPAPDHLPPAPAAHFNFAQHLISRNADRADKIAFIDDAGSLGYGDLAHRIRRLAAGLLAAGVRREERVLLLMHDCHDWPVSFLGALYAGIVPVAVNTLLTADDYAFMLADCRAQAVLVSAALLPQLQAALGQRPHEVKWVIVSRPTQPLPPGALDFEAFLAAVAPLAQPADTGPDEPAFWLYSSGSTGRPKGTVHSHANPYWTAELYGTRLLGLREQDVCFSAAKLFFAYGLGNGLTFPMSVGATTLLMAERPTPEAVFKRWLGQTPGQQAETGPGPGPGPGPAPVHQPTVFFGAPTGFAGMLASPHLPAPAELALRLCSSAGEALPADLGQRFTARFGVEIIDGIGSTEMLHIYLSNAPGRVRYGSTGWPVPGYLIELRGEDGQVVPEQADGPTETGELYIQGPSAALMYWGNREKSRQTFQGAWTKSGDKYSRNADGSYTYAGRSDDMLKVSGLYVSPFEVEATLALHPAVLEAAVIGVTDADGLTRSKAFVVRKAGAAVSEDELKAFVKERLAPYKYPRAIEFLDDLPKTATGKIQRFKLREKEAAPR